MDEKLLQKSVERIHAAFPEEVAAVYLFGSEARGEASSASDVDLGVLLREMPPRTFESRRFDLAESIAESIGREVDLVLLNAASPDFAIRVLRHGRVVDERDRSARIRFEVATRNAYFDLLPYLSRYRAAALDRASHSNR